MNFVIDLSLISEVEFENIRHYDAPDYCDAFISAAMYNGKEASQDVLEALNDSEQYADWKYQKLMDFIY
jgi:hypothetical protein